MSSCNSYVRYVNELQYVYFYLILVDVYLYLRANPFRPCEGEATNEKQAGYDSWNIGTQIGYYPSQWA